MKLHIIVETINDVKKYYPNISDNTFTQLIKLDPTYKGNDSVGKYGKWLLNLYNKGNLSEDEFKDVPNLLNQFTTYRNRIQNKDLNSYKSLDALADILSTVVNDDSMLTDRQKVRFLKNVKSGKVKIDAENDYDIVLDTPNFIVYVPNTHEASMKLGKGTNWCTAHENPESYEKYTADGGKLYIIKDKKTNERWQYSDSRNDFLDENDEEFNHEELMKKDKKLSNFFKKFLNIDFYDFDGTWVYNGTNILPTEKDLITNIKILDDVTSIGNHAFAWCKNVKNVTIPNNVTSIEDWAFAYCESLTNVVIPNSVTEIGDYAFAGCQALKSITIPSGVTSIGDYAFSSCQVLKSITIPNSVTSIGEYTFQYCSKLSSITIPNSVTSIGDGTFIGCTNLTIYTNNDYVKQYCKKQKVTVKPVDKKEYYKKPFKLHIKESISDKIEDTNERCKMEPNEY